MIEEKNKCIYEEVIHSAKYKEPLTNISSEETIITEYNPISSSIIIYSDPISLDNKNEYLNKIKELIFNITENNNTDSIFENQDKILKSIQVFSKMNLILVFWMKEKI